VSATRRHFLTALATAPLAVGRESLPTDTAALDDAMQSVLRRHGIPGGALGISIGGRTVYARGFGLANRGTGQAVTDRSRFRLASLSKPFTAMAVLRLIEDDQLRLEDAILPLLNLEPLGGKLGDTRWSRITVRHLLLHTGGWVKARSGDAMFKSREIAAAAGVQGPADVGTTIRWMLAKKLDADPGSTFSYCNFGYVLLGHLIEQVTGISYEAAVRRLVLKPCGIADMEVGDSLRPRRNEVRYYHFNQSLGPGVFPALPAQVPWPYGTFSVETNAANGGWIGTVHDVLAFLISMDERSARPLLQPATLKSIPLAGLSRPHHGLGWMVKPAGQSGRPDLWYIGGLPGTKTMMFRHGDGFDWVALFNLRPASLDAVNEDIRKSIHTAAATVSGWFK
jgi:N-acyl-D-amino-acid deacylase